MLLALKFSGNAVRFALAVSFCLILIIGCSGKGGPIDPGTHNGNPATDVASQTSSTGTGITQGFVPSAKNGRPSKVYADNEVLVVLKDGVDKIQISSATSGFPLQWKRTIKTRWANIYEMTITDSTPVPDMVARLKADSRVKIVEPNYIYYLCETPYFPNDPMWAGDNPDKDPRSSVYTQWGPAMIGAPLVWNESKGSKNVVLAIIDTGVRKDHEDLAANIWNNADEIPDNGIDDDNNGYIDDTWGWDAANNNNNPYDDGDYASYHGSACAGVAAAVQDNLRGVSGVAPGVQIMAVRTDLTGGGGYASSVIAGIEYARVNHADIASMSFGDWTYSELMENECNDAWDNGNGVILMAAAGNEDDSDIRYPSAYAACITIGAVIPRDPSYNPIDEARISSNIGFYWGSCWGDKLWVMGYGDQYITTYGGHYDTYWDGYSQGFFGGTSCATPMSAGVMALIKSFFPEENAQWCKDRIADTADDIGAVGFDDQTGHGRCNVLRAIYGSDRYKDQEDANGFVPLTLPVAQIYDSIQDLTGNPYYDKEDLYKLHADKAGTLDIYLDIYTWGENLDMSVYTDPEMTQLVDSAAGPNHGGSSFEELFINAVAGTDYYIRVFSPVEGNSTTYGLIIHQMTNDIWVAGQSLAPTFIHQEGTKVPFLKLTFTAGSQATLDELVINKHGTIPNANWINARLYEDTNGNGALDGPDHLLAQMNPQSLNRVRFDGLNIAWNYHQTMVLFFAADFSQTTTDSTVSFSLESYKDVATVEGIVADYKQFPIGSDSLLVGTDRDAPVWDTTIGVQSAEPSYLSAKLGWNSATDVLDPPTKYNVYYTDTLPFNIGTATKLSNVAFLTGTATDCKFVVSNLPADVPEHFVVRAEDMVGNEDDNLVVLDATPSSNSDPANPVILASYPLDDAASLAISGSLLAVAENYYGLTIYDRTDPINLVKKGTAAFDYYYYDVVLDGNYAYTTGYDYLSVIDVTNPSSPSQAATLDLWDGMSLCKIGNWVYASGSYANAILPVDVSDPHNIKPKSEVSLVGYGYPYDMKANLSNLYVANYYNGIQVFDRSTPGAPVLENTFGSDSVVNLVLNGTSLFATDYAVPSPFYSYNIGADPTNPPLLDTVSTGPGSDGNGIAIVDHYAYIARNDYGIVVFDIADPTDLKYMGSLPLTGVVDLVSEGQLVYAIGRDAGGAGYLDVIL